MDYNLDQELAERERMTFEQKIKSDLMKTLGQPPDAIDELLAQQAEMESK